MDCVCIILGLVVFLFLKCVLLVCVCYFLIWWLKYVVLINFVVCRVWIFNLIFFFFRVVVDVKESVLFELFLVMMDIVVLELSELLVIFCVGDKVGEIVCIVEVFLFKYRKKVEEFLNIEFIICL